MNLRLPLLLLASSLLVGCPSVDDDDDSRATDCSDLAASQYPPELGLTAPPNSTIYAGTDEIPVIGNVTDEGTDSADLELELFDVINVEPEPLDVSLPVPDGSGDFSFSIPAGVLDQGEHVLRLLATDPDGCTGYEEAFVCIDTADCLGS